MSTALHRLYALAPAAAMAKSNEFQTKMYYNLGIIFHNANNQDCVVPKLRIKELVYGRLPAPLVQHRSMFC